MRTREPVQFRVLKNDETLRGEIVRKAATIIDKSGEGAVRVRDVCAKTKTTAPTIYRLFGDREGLITSAHAYNFIRGQAELAERFATAIYDCKNKSSLVAIVHGLIDFMFTDSRSPHRRTRAEVLGAAMSNKSLAKTISEAQSELNKKFGEPVRFAQAKGWVRDDFSCEAFIAWLTGITTFRTLIELDPKRPLADEWDKISTKAICAVLGIPEPKKVKGIKN